MGAKRKTGKFASLLCSNYVNLVIEYTLKQGSQPVVRSLQTRVVSPRVMVYEVGESNRVAERKVRPISTPERVLIWSTIEMMTPISVPRESNQLGFQRGVTEGSNLKEVILGQIFQLQFMMNKLEDDGSFKKEQEQVIKVESKSKMQVKRELDERVENWSKKKQRIQHILENQRQELLQTCKSYRLEQEKINV
uniref:Predicted protein n=1 Tax=Physcomitrium patens TaxID=3218 RepID=A9U554_PHYPA